jgi:gas vesicle protein
MCADQATAFYFGCLVGSIVGFFTTLLIQKLCKIAEEESQDDH